MVLDAGFKAAEETGRDGIGVDLFFGGGEPDFAGQAKKGRLVPLRVFETHPELFGEDGADSRNLHRRALLSAGSRVGGHLHVAVRDLLQSGRAQAARESPRPLHGATSAIRDTRAPSPWRIRPRAARSPGPSSCWSRARCSGHSRTNRTTARRALGSRLGGGLATDPADGGERALLHRQRVEDPARRRPGQRGRRHVHRFLRPLLRRRTQRKPAAAARRLDRPASAAPP